MHFPTPLSIISFIAFFNPVLAQDTCPDLVGAPNAAASSPMLSATPQFRPEFALRKRHTSRQPPILRVGGAVSILYVALIHRSGKR